MIPQPRYQSGERIGGRYLVHKALMGGMGEVYLCLDLEEMIPLALKTFQQRYVTDAQRLRRAFEQEVATWVALEKHPTRSPSSKQGSAQAQREAFRDCVHKMKEGN